MKQVARKQALGITAKMNTTYSYTKWNGESVVLPVGTRVLVDFDKLIAKHQDDYFSIEYSDVKVIASH